MNQPEVAYGVWMADSRAGIITQRGDHTRFTLDEEYRNNPFRPVLGLIFEQDLLKPHAAKLRLPPWFSNLLPEGRLREWIADDRGVSADREMELLAQVGHDLPGAECVLQLRCHRTRRYGTTPTTVTEDCLSRMLRSILAGDSPWRVCS